MSITRRIARPLLAASFVQTGVSRLRSPEGASYLKPVIDAAAKTRPELRPLKGQEVLVGQAVAATQIGAGLLFALGKLPRVSSTLLIATGAINAYVDFRASEASTKQEKEARLAGGVKNASLVGAVILTSVDTEGNPSLVWRAEKFGHDVKKKSAQVTKDVKKKTDDVFGG